MAEIVFTEVPKNRVVARNIGNSGDFIKKVSFKVRTASQGIFKKAIISDPVLFKRAVIFKNL